MVTSIIFRTLAISSSLFICLACAGDDSVEGGNSGAGCENFNDGVADDIGTSVDQNGDGLADGLDNDGDGLSDGLQIDRNGDGFPDGIGIDLTGNCVIDAADFDGDGAFETISKDSNDFEDKRQYISNLGQ